MEVLDSFTHRLMTDHVIAEMDPITSVHPSNVGSEHADVDSNGLDWLEIGYNFDSWVSLTYEVEVVLLMSWIFAWPIHFANRRE